MSERRYRVFVYGTLLKGESNHHLLERYELLATGRTEPRFELADFGDYPGMVGGGDTAIAGEIYEIDDAALELLDALEEVPDYYRRVWFRVDGDAVQGYVLPAAEAQGMPRLPSGDWRQRHRDRKR